ncbi:aromatic amino acid aminotransferase, partial [Pseudoalteromonas phenolica]
AGVTRHSYPYVDENNRLDFDGMLATLKTIPEGDVVVLHACCHNPTGFDLSREQWDQVLEVVQARKLRPL